MQLGNNRSSADEHAQTTVPEHGDRRSPRPAGAQQEAAERQHAVAAALASVRAEGLEPGAEDLALFAEVAAGRLSTDELRERVLSCYRR